MIDPDAILTPRADVRITLLSRGHAIVTNGWCAVAWPHDGPVDTSRDAHYSSAHPADDALDGAIWPEHPTEPIALDLVAFRAWLARVVPPEPPPAPPPAGVECPECRGRGIVTETCSDCGHEHDHDCPECEGDGKVEPELPAPPPVSEVVVHGGRVNGWFLARALRALPGDTATWQRDSAEKLAVALIVGDGWRFVAMPMAGECAPVGTWPERAAGQEESDDVRS